MILIFLNGMLLREGEGNDYILAAALPGHGQPGYFNSLDATKLESISWYVRLAYELIGHLRSGDSISIVDVAKTSRSDLDILLQRKEVQKDGERYEVTEFFWRKGDEKLPMLSATGEPMTHWSQFYEPKTTFFIPKE